MHSPHYVALSILCSIFFCARCEQCGKSIYSGMQVETKLDRIIGGVDSKKGAWPWMAALAVKGDNEQPDFVCGGAIISDRLVLTAAHCTGEPIYLVRLGVNVLMPDSPNKTDVLVKKMIVHEGFEFPKHEHDIAILLLSKRITFTDWIQPICIPRVDMVNGRESDTPLMPYVAGWGDVVVGEGTGSLVLKEVRLPVQPIKKCLAQYQTINEVITDKNLCAGYDEGGRDACQGDSGGPLMLAGTGEHNDTYYTIGVVSFGKSCALANFPGVFTSVYAYLDWIDAILNKIQTAREKKSEADTEAARAMSDQRRAPPVPNKYTPIKIQYLP